MTDMVVEQAPLLVKIRDVLRAAGLRCEIGRSPPPQPGEEVPKVPYVIVYAIDGGEFLGAPLGAPDACGTQIVQLTNVGATGQQVAKVADKARRTLLGRTASGYTANLDSEGQVVGARWSTGPGGHDADSVLLSLPERYGFFVNSA